MLNFYPGPSKLYPETRVWLPEIYDSGILSKNHRSADFMQLWADTKEQLHDALAIPAGYEIYITSSATECWEIVNQSLLLGNVHYLYNGAFGEKWFDYARKNAAYSKNSSLQLSGLPFLLNGAINDVLPNESDTICVTHNETSNGTFVTDESLKLIRSTYQNAVIAVDATSSMAGVALPWKTADVWFASVQKCFGLPSGLAVMVVSPKAIQRAEEVNEKAHYNSLLNIRTNFLKNQTPYTPNILGIALLNEQAGFVEKIGIIDQKLRDRASRFYEFIANETQFDLLVENEVVRSPTVISVKADNPQKVIVHLTKNNIIAGKGYGEWKSTTFRIANFPAIKDEEFEELKKALQDF